MNSQWNLLVRVYFIRENGNVESSHKPNNIKCAQVNLKMYGRRKLMQYH